MAKNYFQFKQFTVYQERCGLKVSTEACILGAYVKTGKAKSILDIGAGTALLSLMLAQRSQADIVAVEMDEMASQQAQENITASPWSSITLFSSTIQNFTYQSKFDIIVTNPPFFDRHVKARDTRKNQALHTDTLSFEDLLKAIKKHLSPLGKLWILLPPYPMQRFTDLAKTIKLHKEHLLFIHHSEQHPVLREIAVFSYSSATSFSAQTLYIRDQKGNYTPTFRDLLTPYYLIF
ncbi:MAG: tRNA1(Val) (adenine(37)-N6)-methyltransferase [Thermonemataceae bacterium]